ncbi:MAG: HlyD family efflux transporter periplasmic adaptor subunit [Ectothiorhodospiraceae bacterium]|nr:HlyD family efflux transporter periplasmic adaptor subunit [Ectothiorhodospiraceae bacterium]
MSLRKKIVTALIALAILGLLVLALMPAPVPVSVSTVQQAHFAEYVEDEGRAQVRDPHTVSAPISGFLRRVVLEPGDSVAAGDALFEMEALPSPALDARTREQAREAVSAARARLELAQAELEIRQTQREIAESEYRRNLELYEQQFISAEMMDRSRAQRDAGRAAERAARHGMEVARFELEAARVTLAIADGQRAPDTQPTLTVRAPINGTIINRHRCCEGPINAGEPVLEIGDLSTLEVRIDLLSMDAVRVRPGMRVLLERWGGAETLEGEVRRVEPRGFQRISALGVEEQRVPVLVAIRSPREAWEALGDGYRVEGRFILWEADQVVQIPTSALFREDDRWKVFVAADGRAERRPVEVGRRSGLRSQILDGLNPGEQVITHPSDRIAHRTRVAPEQR